MKTTQLDIVETATATFSAIVKSSVRLTTLIKNNGKKVFVKQKNANGNVQFLPNSGSVIQFSFLSDEQFTRNVPFVKEYNSVL